MILDRNGEVLANNAPTYSLEVIPERTPGLSKTLEQLKALLHLGDDDIRRFHSLRQRHKGFESIPLKVHLSDEDMARFAVNLNKFPGVSIQGRLVRNYPYGDFTSHVVGYVGRINEQELQTLDQAAYRGTHYIGKTGIERTYEEQLHGKTGYEEMETNVQGRSINAVGTVPAESGYNLQLSLDVKLQQTAYQALDKYDGAIVAMEPATGRVLVLASKPGFDPNLFVTGIDDASYNTLQNAEDRPLYNRAIRGHYPPGSTVKPFMGLAGLEIGGVLPSERVSCPGFYQLPGQEHRYRDWRKSGHGSVDMPNAITQSCDVYFYELAHRLGIDRMHDFLGLFGFGQKSGVDLPGETAGMYPSREWKRKTRRQAWYPGETLIAGIGQGYVQVTPIQLARAVSILANRGKRVTPRLVDKLASTAGAEYENPNAANDGAEFIKVRDSSWNTVIQAMIDVVHSPHGTAKGIAPGLTYQVAGKTGTAQVFTVRQDEEYKDMHVADKLKDHAWFIAFAPADNPRIVIVVLAEHGGHGGSVAAPMARQVIEQYLSGIL
ncbi:penicillin-binding protein 2 [Methylogaea oryzae]|uniref:penicillin-binding protein 2 n=1 Tax=Methylogaea oryzae TaxID=1295382 RepID=UPI000A4FDB16|nr:penicillin-binding protein 2 [Methylogaea oryzae]